MPSSSPVPGAAVTVKISAIETYEITLPLVHFFETSFGRTTERRIILVRVADEDGAEGWGECTAGEGPFYCEEWTAGASSVIKTYLAPISAELQPSAPSSSATRTRMMRRSVVRPKLVSKK